MLTELHVRNLGVIDDLSVVLLPPGGGTGGGMTAITGETGAGKTLLIEAISLLMGGRADPVRVRAGAEEALVEGRFVIGDDETVLARIVPASGRSRAYLNGRLAPVGALADIGTGLLDLHGQHAHQSLLAARHQRAALDRFAGVNLDTLERARAEVAGLTEAIDALGGDAHARAREIDLLRYQVDELEAAGVQDPDEEAHLDAEEERLANVEALRQAAEEARDALVGDGAARDNLGRARAALSGPASSPASFGPVADRLDGVLAELDDVVAQLRAHAEGLTPDPERLAAVQQRRHLLREMRRKYGEPLEAVMAYREQARTRLHDLEGHEDRVEALEAQRAAADDVYRKALAAVRAARCRGAPELASRVETELHGLGLPGAGFAVTVDGDGGEDVVFQFAAGPGAPLLPLAKAASGGELARAMLALRLVLRDPSVPVLVFDEVDAGIGGRAATAVGRALASLAHTHQVLVVTHLPQVAAFADRQVAVSKASGPTGAVATANALADGDRVVELSRMLSGQPDSETARDHAQELLAAAARERAR